MSVVAPFGQNPSPAGPDIFLHRHGLTGRQKAAVIVRLLLAEGADLPIAGLPDHLQAALTEQIGAMQTIDRDTLAAVVEEFCETLERVGLSFPGGIDGALEMLDGHISANAATRLRRLAGASSKIDPWEKLRAAEVERLLPLVTEESIEVAAVILSKITVPRAAEILGRLPGDRARAIALAMSRTGNIEAETVRRIGLALVSQLDAVRAPVFEGRPADRVGAILNLSPAATRDEVLRGLEEEDSGLAEEVKKTIFTFAHIPARILPRDVPKILKAIDQEALIRALGGAGSSEAAEFILSNMSQRMAATLREEIAVNPRFREKEVEAAQTAIVLAIRDLEGTGELALVRADDGEDG